MKFFHKLFGRFFKHGTLVIVDGSYLSSGLRNVTKGDRVDYRRFSKIVSMLNNAQVRDMHFFDAMPSQSSTGAEQYLFNIREAGYELNMYSIKKRQSTCGVCGEESIRNVQRGVDVGIALKLVLDGASYRRVILVAGDSDFEAAVSFLRKSKVEVWAMGFEGSMSNSLKIAASRYISLNQYAQEFSFTEGRRKQDALKKAA